MRRLGLYRRALSEFGVQIVQLIQKLWRIQIVEGGNQAVVFAAADLKAELRIHVACRADSIAPSPGWGRCSARRVLIGDRIL